MGPHVFLLWDVCLGVDLLLVDFTGHFRNKLFAPYKKQMDFWSYFLDGSGDNHRESLFITHLESFLTTRVHLRHNNCFFFMSISMFASFTLF